MWPAYQTKQNKYMDGGMNEWMNEWSVQTEQKGHQD